jgi:outer membrane protein assembly factor BamD
MLLSNRQMPCYSNERPKLLKASHYAEARTLLEVLIRSYPNSDYVARAKSSIGDAWYAESVLQRALMEYQDFVTFFPNRPEAVEAKQKIEAIQTMNFRKIASSGSARRSSVWISSGS